MDNIRKVVLVGTGMVGTSYAYAMLNQNACDELVLVDRDTTRAAGEAMDLNHGLAFGTGHMKIRAGTYADCADAGMVAICAGVAQRPGESRPALLGRNAEVFRSITAPVLDSGFGGLFLVATNPVDIMARITQAQSGFDPARVIGTGTALDTARLRYLLGDFFGVDPRSVHAYVLGEHGDTEFVPWSQAMIATKPVSAFCGEGVFLCGEQGGCTHGAMPCPELGRIEAEVRTAAEKIIQAKHATYYGIGMAMARITRAVFGDEHSVLTVSAMLHGEYGESEVYAGVPCIVGRGGVRQILELDLTDEELGRFHTSCAALRALYDSVERPV